MNGYVGKRELKWVCVEDDENPSCRGYIQQCMKVFLKSTSSSSEYEVSSSHPHKTFSVLTGLPSNSFWPVDCLLNLQTTKAVANKKSCSLQADCGTLCPTIQLIDCGKVQLVPTWSIQPDSLFSFFVGRCSISHQKHKPQNLDLS